MIKPDNKVAFDLIVLIRSYQCDKIALDEVSKALFVEYWTSVFQLCRLLPSSDDFILNPIMLSNKLKEDLIGFFFPPTDCSHVFTGCSHMYLDESQLVWLDENNRASAQLIYWTTVLVLVNAAESDYCVQYIQHSGLWEIRVHVSPAEFTVTLMVWLWLYHQDFIRAEWQPVNALSEFTRGLNGLIFSPSLA